jgi:uncharacterized iron-regulated membrane protein
MRLTAVQSSESFGAAAHTLVTSMSVSPSLVARLRSFWWTLHRWIALALCVLLVPIAISGAPLVWKDALDALVHPARYAVTGTAVTSPSVYLESARTALPPGFGPMAVRFPADEGQPVTVMARGEGAGARQLLIVYHDPPTGRALDVVDFRSSLFGFLHRFHENLTIPEYSGRAIVGWAGVGMLILSLTGIWLWWPRNGAFLRGLRWHRSTLTTANLHHLFGFWISLPLAFVSLTGIYLGFPQTARSTMAAIAPMSPQGRSVFAGQIARDTQLSADAALEAARAAKAGWQPAAVFLATLPQGQGQGQGGGRRGPGERRDAEQSPAPTWRIQLRHSQSLEVATVLVNDHTRDTQVMPAPLAGDRAAQWIRFLHDGSRGGIVWQWLVFLTGVFPPIFAVTGITMWLRGRRRRVDANRSAGEAGAMQAAE